MDVHADSGCSLSHSTYLDLCLLAYDSGYPSISEAGYAAFVSEVSRSLDPTTGSRLVLHSS